MGGSIRLQFKHRNNGLDDESDDILTAYFREVRRRPPVGADVAFDAVADVGRQQVGGVDVGSRRVVHGAEARL